MNAVKPEDLSVALLLGDFLRLHGYSIVCRSLCKAGAAGNGADIMLLDVNFNGSKSVVVICADGRKDYNKKQMLRRMNTDHGINSEDIRTDIERSALAVRYPVLIDLDKGLDSLNAECLVDLRDAETLVGDIKSRHILIGAEKADAAVGSSVCLESLEVSLAIVQAHRRGIKSYRSIGHDSRVVPAFALVIVHNKHMVGKYLAEAEFCLVCGLCFRSGSTLDSYLLHNSISFILNTGVAL